MIGVKFGEYRFYSGDNVTYNDSSYDYLYEQAATAESLDLRRYAAAGVVRGLLDLPASERQGQQFFDAVNWGTGLILDVLRGETPREADATIWSFLNNIDPVNGVFDSTSIAATNSALRHNNPRTTRAAIEKCSPAERPKLMIALGHGGVVSSLATFAEMPEESLVYPVRFSRHKAKDTSPMLSDAERDLLYKFSEGRDVIVHDEDRGFSGTITAATMYFGTELSRPTYGVTPATGRHPNGYEPQVVWYGEDGRVNMDTYNLFSDKLEELRSSIAEPVV